MKKRLLGTFTIVKIGLGMLLLIGVMLWLLLDLKVFKSSLIELIQDKTGLAVELGSFAAYFFPQFGSAVGAIVG